MDLNQLANLGEFIGGVAVLVTLVYLAVQLTQSNKIQRAESVRAFLSEYNTTLRAALEPDVDERLRRAVLDFDGMPKEDQSIVHIWATTHMMLALGSHVLDQQKMSDPRISNLAMGFNATVLATPGMRQWWEHVKPIGDPSFVRRVDALLDSGEVPAMHEMWAWFQSENVPPKGA